MLKLNGRNLKEALDAVLPALTLPARKEAAANAKQIVSAIIKASGKKKKKNPRGKKASACTGLIYGRIQSGKTRAMIIGSALAFDNNIRVVVAFTTNNN